MCTLRVFVGMELLCEISIHCQSIFSCSTTAFYNHIIIKDTELVMYDISDVLVLGMQYASVQPIDPPEQ